jgi:Uma2 family endonuclease
MGETGIQVAAILGLLAMLQRYYRGNSRVAVHANMFLYYVEGDPSKNVSPDLFITLDVPAEPTRRTFKIWKEGKAPDLIIEVTSRKTRREDKNKKLPLYRDVLKVREYFLFDPEEEYLDPSLQGYRLVGGEYIRIIPEDGRLPSEVLGLHLERDGLDLRLYNPRTGRWIPTQEELEKELEESKATRQREAAARRREEAARRKAEAEVERLRREIDALRKRISGDS